MATKDRFYEILKGELESKSMYGYICDNLKDPSGLFYEDYNSKVAKTLSVITYVAKDPEKYKRAWIRWAKEQNETIKSDATKIRENELLDNCYDVDKSGKVSISIPNFVDYILTRFNFKTINGTKTDQIYIFEGGIYRLKGEQVIKKFSEEKLGKYSKTNLVKEIIEKIKRKTMIDFEDFDITPIHLIPLENGMYNIHTNTLEEYNSELYFKFKLPVYFDVNANCDMFLKLINEILYPQDIDIIQEWFGFCLYRKYFIKKGCIWVGESDTGKTTLLKILEGLIGEKNLSGLSLQRISANDKFGLSSLHNKQLNSYDDLSSRDINDGGGFKIVTGGGRITAERKFGDSFKFMNYSKLLFACNKIPPVKDIDDPAYFSRWIPVSFDNQVEVAEQNPNLAEECLKESSGIFNWTLIGLIRLLKNNKFSFYGSPDEVKTIMCRSGNPLYSFAQDVLERDDGGEISKEQIYQIYLIYVNEKGHSSLSKEQLGRQLKKVVSYIDQGKKNVRHWKNVKINSRYDGRNEIQNIIKGNKTL